MGKGEIARSEQFLLIPQCFQLNQIFVFPFVHIFDIISLFAIELEEPKIGVSGKGLIIFSTESCVLWILKFIKLLKTLRIKQKKKKKPRCVC